MARDDWFRQTTWTTEIQKAFFARLARVRANAAKAQRVRIQAWVLHEHGHHSSALELAEYLLAFLPEPFELAIIHSLRGDCFAALSRLPEAVDAYRKAMQAERALPSVSTNARIDFAWLVATSGLTELYDEALVVLTKFQCESTLAFPVLDFRFAVAQALIADARGQRDMARTWSCIALQRRAASHSGFRYHANLGLVGSVDPSIERRLREIASQ